VPELWKTPRPRFPQLLGRRGERRRPQRPTGIIGFKEKKKKNGNHYNDARHARRVTNNTDVFASLRSDHDAPERVITMAWTK
jgi:hypothetical protein